MVARRFIVIAKNAGAFIFAFELGFNRYIRKAKEFFPNIDTNFLILIDLDAQSLIKEVLRGDPYSFVVATNTILDIKMEIIDANFKVKDNPPLKASGVEKGKSSSSLYPKPSRAPRSKRRRK